jgi:potassium-transporting ATPase KdpC subunit
MKQYILPALKLTLACIVFFCGIYTLIVFGIAQLVPNQGLGETLSLNGKVVGYALEGQAFSQDKYFWSRPSAVSYNAAGSGGSNKGPFNPDYLKDIQTRIDTFLTRNPGIEKADIPSELITASGSGLDPDLSQAGALVQVKRIAFVRRISEQRIRNLISAQTDGPFLGLFGPAKVNILKLNIALDTLK